MKQTVIYNRNGWRVTSYGNGTSYTLENTATGKSVCFQGDDATAFSKEFMHAAGYWRAPLAAIEERFGDYSEVME